MRGQLHPFLAVHWICSLVNIWDSVQLSLHTIPAYMLFLIIMLEIESGFNNVASHLLI